MNKNQRQDRIINIVATATGLLLVAVVITIIAVFVNDTRIQRLNEKTDLLEKAVIKLYERQNEKFNQVDDLYRVLELEEDQEISVEE